MSWGNAVGAAIGAIASHIEGAFNRRHNAKEARAADSRAMQMWSHQEVRGPTLSRIGYEEAGLNPMLAMNGGSASHGTPSTHSGSSSSIADVVGSAKQGAELVNEIMHKLKLDNKKTAKEIENLDANIENKKADTEKKGVDKYKNPRGVAIKGLVDLANGDKNRDVKAMEEATKYFTEKFRGLRESSARESSAKENLKKLPVEQRDLNKPSSYEMPSGPKRGAYPRYKKKRENENFRRRYLSRPLFH